MFYENELQFLCDTFKKSHVRTVVAAPNDFVSYVLDKDFDVVSGKAGSSEKTICEFVGKLESDTVYKVTDAFKRCYIYLLLPDMPKTRVLFIGPYLSASLSPHETLEIGERMGISPKSQRYLDEYYAGIPVLPDSSHLFAMLDTFCERIWKRPSFAVIDLNNEYQISDFDISENSSYSNDFDDVLVNMKAMETRYNFENEMIQAVTLGQIHKEKRLFSAFSETSFEKRATDPLRNAKNYCIIMNTLLRKAAENGGVHPVHLDNMSSMFALRIEQLSNLAESSGLMKEMFRSYCRLVRKHAVKNFSPVVQKTILLIESDLSASLALKSLAEFQNVSAGYLSTIFRKETGKTISEYIRKERIKYAIHLLSTTHLQIQTIALHCGIMDVQYFSKMFKKQTGKTPKEYRESVKQTKNNII